MNIKVASRASRLAMIQTEYVINEIKKYHSNITFEIIPITTTGDKILNKTLDKIGGKGLFMKELELALLEGKADIAVHSMKDIPVDLSETLPILAVSPRENPFDVLVLPKGIEHLDLSKPIGTSSNRRKIQATMLYPDVKVAPVRGNVISRLEKLDSGEFSALILAYAGLKRLNLEERITRVFTAEEMLPSACQGVIAVQGRDVVDPFFLEAFHNIESQLVTSAERVFLKKLNGGCSSPVACFGTISENKMTLSGLYVDDMNKIHKNSVNGKVSDGEQLGGNLADLLTGGCYEKR